MYFIFVAKVVSHALKCDMRNQSQIAQNKCGVLYLKKQSAHLQMSQANKATSEEDCLYSENPQEAIKVHTVDHTEILFNFKRK